MFSGPLWLFGVFCGARQIRGWSCYFCGKGRWECDQDCSAQQGAWGARGRFPGHRSWSVSEARLPVCVRVCPCHHCLTVSFRIFRSMVKFIPKYFIVFSAIVNGIAHVISLSYNSLTLCRNAAGFCMSIFVSVTLPDSFIRSNSVLVGS